MKTCKSCEQIKSLEEFPKRARNKDGYLHICKVCKQAYDNAYYQSNPNRKQYIRKNSRNRVEQAQEMVYNYLLDHPCVDCGESEPLFLEFDHQELKLENISTIIHRWGLERIKEEISKCDVRCVRCHRIKTAKDFGWYRAKRAGIV